MLFRSIDVEDPIEVGNDVEYIVRLLNQGSATETHVRLAIRLPASQQFVSGDGATPIQSNATGLSTDPIASLPPKGSAEWRIKVKATAEDDARFVVELTSDQSIQPIRETESTRQY